MTRHKFFSKSIKSTDDFHEKNEDYLMYSKIAFMDDEDIEVFVIADGMGGMDDGEKASRTATLSFISNFYRNVMEYYVPARENFSILHYCSELRQAILDAFYQANSEVCNTAEPGIRTGTTLSVVVCLGDYLIAANVGDSPIYYYSASQGKMEIVSQLQTKAEQDYKKGKYERFSEEYFENDHIITYYLGGYRDLDMEKISFFVKEQVQAGDSVLLGSDGAFGWRMPNEIYSILSETTESQALIDLFESASKDKEDDQSAFWIKFKER